MNRFLIFYFVAYGGAHLYFFHKLKKAFPLSRNSLIISGTMLALLFLAPLISRKLESTGLDILPELLSGTGYIWMGILFLFVTAAATIDIWNLIFAKTHLSATPNQLFLVASTYTLFIGIYGYYEADNVITEHISIESSHLPQNVSKIRIVQISDLHIGQIVRERRVRSVIDKIKQTSPDMIVSTGDLVDGHQRHFAGLEQYFKELNPKLGKYAILGNHEYYVGINESAKFITDAGFKLLVNETCTTGGICIIGVDDSKNSISRTENALIEQKLLRTATSGEFKLLLKHRPIIEKDSAGNFDLQLSGHVHKGQIFPFNFLTWLSFPVRTGLTLMQNGSNLYVSRGTGVWGPPIRFLAPPEVTVIDVLRAPFEMTKFI